MDPTLRFSGRVEDYVRYRPGYPREVLAFLGREYGMVRGAVVADVGSGTGLLARMFLENGNRVYGVEPNPEMRRAGEVLLGSYGKFVSVAGTAERTTLPDGSADFVTAGQAFHWFDPGPTRGEFVRVLRPGGRVVLVWNERQGEGSGFATDYEALLKVYGTDYERVNHRGRGSSEEIRRFFAPSVVNLAVFDNAQALDLDGLRGRLLSSSYVPARGEPGCEEMLAELERVFRRHESDGRVVMRYETRVYVGELDRA